MSGKVIPQLPIVRLVVRSSRLRHICNVATGKNVWQTGTFGRQLYDWFLGMTRGTTPFAALCFSSALASRGGGYVINC